jgi:hypothetical protein
MWWPTCTSSNTYSLGPSEKISTLYGQAACTPTNVCGMLQAGENVGAPCVLHILTTWTVVCSFFLSRHAVLCNCVSVSMHVLICVTCGHVMHAPASAGHLMKCSFSTPFATYVSLGLPCAWVVPLMPEMQAQITNQPQHAHAHGMFALCCILHLLLCDFFGAGRPHVPYMCPDVDSLILPYADGPCCVRCGLAGYHYCLIYTMKQALWNPYCGAGECC